MTEQLFLFALEGIGARFLAILNNYGDDKYMSTEVKNSLKWLQQDIKKLLDDEYSLRK